jgi:hypothetical protein
MIICRPSLSSGYSQVLNSTFAVLNYYNRWLNFCMVHEFMSSFIKSDRSQAALFPSCCCTLYHDHLTDILYLLMCQWWLSTLWKAGMGFLPSLLPLPNIGRVSTIYARHWGWTVNKAQTCCQSIPSLVGEKDTENNGWWLELQRSSAPWDHSTGSFNHGTEGIWNPILCLGSKSLLRKSQESPSLTPLFHIHRTRPKEVGFSLVTQEYGQKQYLVIFLSLQVFLILCWAQEK